MIRLDAAEWKADGRKLLGPISLELSERRIGLIGLNGSGKSTLVRLFNALYLPSRGRVEVDGLDSRKHSRALRRKVGFLFQNPDNQIVFPQVREDLAFGLKPLGLVPDELNRRLDAQLEAFGLSHLAESFCHRLSGGEKQLLALAAVMIGQPDYLVLDEPTTLLDLKNKSHILKKIKGLKAHCILVTHDLDLLSDFERVICLHEGRIFADGSPAEVISAYRTVALC